jgi:murein L,D-transpeptidase YcbB/YkuD
VVEGERTHSDLLRRFYAARNYDTVWDKQPGQAEAMLGAVGRAEEHGLNPNLFHAGLLQRRSGSLAPLDRELLISDAVLGFADALTRGAVPPEERPSTWALTPGKADILAAVDKVLAYPNPAQALEGLAPQTPEYAALQRAYAAARAPAAPVPVGRGQRAAAPASSGQGSSVQVKELAVALERQRWLPRQLPATRLWVNTEDAHLDFYRDNQKVFSTRVVVGQVDKQTPEFAATINSLLYNPPWNVPGDIAEKEILSKLDEEPDYLERHNMVMRDNGSVTQLPGSGTALGRLKFEMEDRFDVYLHDTPLRQLFARENRRLSHGCVRVQNPRDLAALLADIPVDTINKAIATSVTARHMLPSPVPVFITYQTAYVAADGQLQFRRDAYRRDDAVWHHLVPTGQPPVAGQDSGAQRKG